MVKISKAQMAAWTKMESEHSPNPMKQRRIVMEHVKQHGIGYYPALQRMERNLERRGR